MATALAFSALASLAAASPPTVKLRNGVEMPMVAAGTWQYNSTEASSSIKSALAAGFTMVDTALDYRNQDGVGVGIASVPRKSIFVETKVPGCMLDKSTINPFRCYADTHKNLEEDLRLLNVTYVDLVIVHFPPGPTMLLRSCGLLSCPLVREQWRAMEEFYKAGKARAIGVSNYCPSCFDCLNNASVFPMVNQVQYHLGMGVDPKGFMSYGKSRGVMVQAYSVLGNSPFSGHASSEILKGNITTSIGRAHNRSSVQVALKWVVAQGVPAVTKSSNPKHLAEDVDLWSWEFNSEELTALNALTRPAGSPSFACSSVSSESLVI